MYPFLALLSGMIISVMIFVNGSLSGVCGVYTAAVIIHIVGVLFSLLVCIRQKKLCRLPAAAPLWSYTGGLIGVICTIFNTMAYGRISMTSIMALGLLGQTAASVLIDSFGLLGMQKHPVRRSSLIGIVLSFAGMLVMLLPDSSAPLTGTVSAAAALSASLLSLAAGVAVVTSRTVNSRFSAHTNPLFGSFINHLTGLPAALLTALLLTEKPWALPVLTAFPFWIYLGGAMGVLVVLLCNILVSRLSAFRLTLLSFTGQVTMGFILDLLSGQNLQFRPLLGSAVIIAGILLNLVLENR